MWGIGESGATEEEINAADFEGNCLEGDAVYHGFC